MQDILRPGGTTKGNDVDIFASGDVLATYEGGEIRVANSNWRLYIAAYKDSDYYRIVGYYSEKIVPRSASMLFPAYAIIDSKSDGLHMIDAPVLITSKLSPTSYFCNQTRLLISDYPGIDFNLTVFNNYDSMIYAILQGYKEPSFIEIPVSISDKSADFYAYGTPVFRKYNLVFRIAWYHQAAASSNSQLFRCCFYKHTDNVPSKTLVIWSKWEMNYITFMITNPSLSPYLTLNWPTPTPNPYGDGYYYTAIVNDTNVSPKCQLYDTLEEALVAMSKGTTPVDTGVVVTCIGTPVAPSNDGVIVTCVGILADPNQQGGTSEPGGGQGTFNDYSDPIPLPPLPTISAANVGLVTLFRPSEIQLRSLGSYLWTNITDFIENLNKLFINPMDYMIALNIFPCNPNVGDERPIKIGSFSTTISMPPVLSQWYEHNCGTLVTKEYWGSALDYAPNTKISLMLPFIGNVQLNPDEVMEKRLGIKYRIDLLSGQCVALISVDDNILYQFTGECSVSVPLTGSDWSRIYSAVVGAIGTAITTGVSTGGIIDVAKTTGRASTAGDRIKRANSIAAGRITGGIANTVNQVMNGKVSINHSGSISGSAGMLGMRYPYLMIEFPNQSLADNYRRFVGYPSNMSSKLGDLEGYTEVEQVIPEGFWGTDDELAELVEALKGGVYL